MQLIHKALDFQVRQVGNPEDRILEFIGSTAAVDRYGDIIEPAGWDLKNYKKNPFFSGGTIIRCLPSAGGKRQGHRRHGLDLPDPVCHR